MSGKTANALGVTSLLLWSMNVGLTRHLGEAHPYGMPALSYLLAGAALLLVDILRGKSPPWRGDARPPFWLLAGPAFVLYMALYMRALTLTPSREAVLALGLVNYLWPSLILLLMPLFFPGTVRWTALLAGTALCIAGVGCAIGRGEAPSRLVAVAGENLTAFAMMLAAAFLWAFYSIAARKWGGSVYGTGIFMVSSGILTGAVWLASGEPLGLNRGILPPLAFHALAVNGAGYLFWDYGVRYGDIGLMGALANFLPLGTMIFGAWYLGNPLHPGLWAGALLVTAGAFLCRRGFVPRPSGK